MRHSVASLCIGLSLSTLFASGCCGIVIDSREEPIFVAHRGASRDAPECTIPAFQLAFQQGADIIEGDFWLTKDQEIVCIHDGDTKKVAPGGPVLKVKDSTLAELQKLDVGIRMGPKFRNTRIPTLAEVLAVVPDDKGIFIEIKDPDVVPHLGPVLDESELRSDQVAVIAFDPFVIQAVKSQYPKLRAIWLYWWYLDKQTGEISNTVDEILRVAKEIVADGIHINRCRWVDAAFVERVREAGLEFLHVYTINEEHFGDAGRFLALGVDSITTDQPKVLRQMVREMMAPQKGDSAKDEHLVVARSTGRIEFYPMR